jgi:hypothetical protein
MPLVPPKMKTNWFEKSKLALMGFSWQGLNKSGRPLYVKVRALSSAPRARHGGRQAAGHDGPV